MLLRVVAALLFGAATATSGANKAQERGVLEPPQAPVVVIDQTPPHREALPSIQKVKHKRIRVSAPVSRVIPTADAFWMALRNCESSDGRTSSNGLFFGYFQFLLSSWRSAGESGVPMDYSYEYQREVAKQWAAMTNPFRQWPTCWPKALSVLG